MTRRATVEPMLPLDFAQPRRPARREGGRLYAATVFLRRNGRVVYRCGSRHKVDGKIAERPQLLALAAGLGWSP
jgi:hypothetical protein